MTTSKHQPRGIALMIVLVTVAVASVLSFALIGSQSMLAQASNNGVKAMQADAMAESGLQLATYYLQNPTAAPVLNSDGYYPGQTGVSLGSATAGTVDIVVTKINSTTYDISCTAGEDNTGTTVRRTVSGRAEMEYAYSAPDAMSMAGSLTVPSTMTINGNLRSTGTVTVGLGGKVNGTVYAPSIVGSLLNVLRTVTGAVTNIEQAAPISIKDFKNYGYKGKQFNAKELKDTDTVVGPTDDNPMGVFFTPDGMEIRSNLVLNGSLITGGDLKIAANSVTITPQSGMPGLLVYKQLKIKGSGRVLTVNGLTWVKDGIYKDGTISLNNKIIVNGALQFPTTAGVSSLLGGTVTVTYDKNKATVRDFVTNNTSNAPYSIRMTSFQTASSN